MPNSTIPKAAPRSSQRNTSPDFISVSFLLHIPKISFQCIPVCRDIRISPQWEANRCNVRAVIIPPEKGSHSKTKPLIIIPLNAKAKKSKSNKMLRAVPAHRSGEYFPLNILRIQPKLRIWCRMNSNTMPVPSHSCACCPVKISAGFVK